MKLHLRWVKLGTIFKWSIRPAVWLYDKTWGTDMLMCEVCAAREVEMNLWAQKALDKLKKRLTKA
jgi:hypothetical protein